MTDDLDPLLDARDAVYKAIRAMRRTKVIHPVAYDNLIQAERALTRAVKIGMERQTKQVAA